MKKIFGLVLALVMLVSVFAVLPAFAEDNAEGKWNVLLNEGIVLNYYEGDVKVGSANVAAKEMAVEQTVSGKTTSVEAYLKGLISGEYGENTKALAAALLNYGAAAYNYFAANNDYEGTPVDGEPVTDTTALKGAEAPEASVTDPDGIYVGASLVLDGTMKLRFYFTGNGLQAEYQDNNQTATDKDGYCYFDVAVMPYAMSESVTIVVGDTTVTYAPINYLQAKADDATLSEMVASIYAYGVAAEAYYVTDGCEHNGDFEFEIIKPATLFTEGEKKNYCSICGDYVNNSSVDKSNVEVESFSTETSGSTLDYHTFNEILDGGNKHFYPTEENPDGQALYIEYSMLWTEEFVNASIGAKDYMLMGRFDSEASNQDSNYDTAYALTIGVNDCWTDNATPGYFDYLGKNVEFVYGDYTYGTNAANCPYIGGYGWHRIGIVIKQIDSSRLNATLYIDGVKLSSHNFEPRNMANLLYTKENGEYKDIDLNRVVRAYYFAESKAEAEVDFKYADLHVTAGDGFVLPVAKLDTPVGADGFDGNFYFEYKGLSDCEIGNHTWATEATVDTEATCTTDGEKSIKCTVCNAIDTDSVETIPGGHKWATEATVDTEATCTTDGQKSVKCTVCEEINPDSIEVIKSAGQHVLADDAVVTRIPTIFSEGLKTGTCTVCDKENSSESIPMEKPENKVVTRSSGTHSNYRWFYEYHFLKDLVSEDNHFYDENNSLYIEYSILVNESFNATVWDGSNAAWFILGTIGNTSGDDGTLNKIGWFHRDANDSACPYVGGVEPNGDVAKFYADNGIVEKQGNYYVMKEELYYGWHRIGVKIDQTHEGKGDNAEYTVTSTIYIDGEAIMDITYSNWKTENLLYTVDEDGVCHDNDNSEIEVTAFILQRLIPKNSSDKIYIPVGDTYVTCGSDFVMPVEKLDTPIEGTYSPASGVTLDADRYFAYVD